MRLDLQDRPGVAGCLEVELSSLSSTCPRGWFTGGLESTGRIKPFQRFTLTLEPELGTVRAMDWKAGGQVFLSGQDRHVVFWSLENGAEERRIETGLVVALVLTQGFVITAGSLQVPLPFHAFFNIIQLAEPRGSRMGL